MFNQCCPTKKWARKPVRSRVKMQFIGVIRVITYNPSFSYIRPFIEVITPCMAGMGPGKSLFLITKTVLGCVERRLFLDLQPFISVHGLF